MWTLQDAKNRFSTVVEAALSGQPQQVTRRGQKVVTVVATSDYERLLHLAGGPGRSFKDHLLAFPNGDIEFDRIDIVPRDIEF